MLIKYGEISLKGRNRGAFERQLVANIQAATGVSAERIERLPGRVLITPETETALHWLQSTLGSVFGIHAFVAARVVERDLEAAARVCTELLRPYAIDGTSFRIAARRAAKDANKTSKDINAELGQHVAQALPQLTVDLDRADLVCHVEVHEDRIFIYLGRDQSDGPGGLPVGVSGAGLLSLSGGIDSPVAGWLAMKRGMPLDALHFEAFPFTGKKAQEKVFDIARELSKWKTGPLRVYMPSFAELQQHIADNAPEDYLTLLFRRSMQRIAADIAQQHGYVSLVTGESLAQVASQTLENMAVVERAASLLTLRPLVGLDKSEIMRHARAIGTYEISIRPYEDCCSVFTPTSPHTKARPEDVERIESRLELAHLEQAAAQQAKVFSVTPEAVTESRLDVSS